MRAILAAILCILVLGCSSQDSRLVGVWTTSMSESTLPPIPIPSMEKQIKEGLAAFLLKVRSDHTFYLSSGPANISGTWTFSEGALHLRPTNSTIPDATGNALKLMDAKLIRGSRLSITEPTPIGNAVIVLKKTA